MTDRSLDFEFPVGKKLDQNTLRYRPVWITNLNNSGNTTFSAEYNYSSTTANPFSNNEFIDPNLNGIWGDQWWQMDRVSGTGKARVGIKVAPQASWFPISPCINCRVGVVRHNSLTNSWEFTKPFGVFANENNTYPEAFESALIGTVYSGILSGFSPFTIGFGYPVVLPLQILAFDAVLWGNDAKLNWKLADGHELKRMVVEHGTDGRSFAEIGLVNYEQKNDYEFLHKNIGPGVHYYRIKMESKDGKILYSKVDFVVNKADKTIISGLIQNPVIGGMAMLKVYSPGPQRLEAGVYDMAGRMLLRQQVSLQQGNNIPMLSLAVLPQGIYRIVIKTEDGAMQTLSALKN